MATKAAVVREKLYEVEVKRRRVRAGGGYEPFWKVKNVAEALIDGDTEFRCKDCKGELKMFKRAVPGGLVPYAEHKIKNDAEHCASGLTYKAATDGREPRISPSPVH